MCVTIKSYIYIYTSYMVPYTLHLDLFGMMNKHGTQFVGYPPVRSGRAVLMLSCPWDPTCPYLQAVCSIPFL